MIIKMIQTLQPLKTKYEGRYKSNNLYNNTPKHLFTNCTFRYLDQKRIRSPTFKQNNLRSQYQDITQHHPIPRLYTTTP